MAAVLDHDLDYSPCNARKKVHKVATLYIRIPHWEGLLAALKQGVRSTPYIAASLCQTHRDFAQLLAIFVIACFEAALPDSVA